MTTVSKATAKTEAGLKEDSSKEIDTDVGLVNLRRLISKATAEREAVLKKFC